MRLRLAAGTVLLVSAPFANVSAHAATTVCVGVVVQRDTGSTPHPRACIEVTAGASGSDVLAARARKLGTPAPRYDSSGLLCAIDGYPETGCAERDANGYRYWSYWHHTGGTWGYANTGPSSYEVRDGDGDGDPDLEGWRFQDGGSESAAAAPPGATYDSVCPPKATPTPRPSASPKPSPAAGSGRSATTSPTATAGASLAKPARASASGVPVAISSTFGAEASSEPAPPAVSPTTSTRAPVGAAAAAEPVRREDEPLPVLPIAGVLLIATLGGAGYVRARRSR